MRFTSPQASLGTVISAVTVPSLVVGAVVAVVVEVVVAAGAGAGGAVVGAPTPRRGRRGAYDPDQRDDISHYERRRTLMGD